MAILFCVAAEYLHLESSCGDEVDKIAINAMFEVSLIVNLFAHAHTYLSA